MIHLRIELGAAIRDPGWTCSVTCAQSVRVLSASWFYFLDCVLLQIAHLLPSAVNKSRSAERESHLIFAYHISFCTQTPLLEQFIVHLKFPRDCGVLAYQTWPGARRAEVNAEQCRDPFTRHPWQATCDFFSWSSLPPWPPLKKILIHHHQLLPLCQACDLEQWCPGSTGNEAGVAQVHFYIEEYPLSLPIG